MRQCPRCGFPAFETGDTEPQELYFVCSNCEHSWFEPVRYEDDPEDGGTEALGF